MADFSVNVEALTRMSAQLGSSRESLAAVLTAMSDGYQGNTGTADLDSACSDFHDRWSYGLGKLGDCVDATRTGVDSSARIYAQSDAAVGSAFDQMSGEL